jgi:hypothetical protein
MTDVPATTPKTVRRSGLPRPNIPVQRIGASLAAMSALIGRAFKMAYVDPYSSHRRRSQAVSEDGVDGRDPDW